MDMVAGHNSFMFRIASALKRHGLFGFIRLCIYNLRLMLSGRMNQYRYVYDDAFDKQHGVNTLGSVEHDVKEDSTDLVKHAVRYEPIMPEGFALLLSKTGITDFSRYAFVDVGSGKGRALLMASGYGFKSVSGIEFRDDLHQIACRNIEAFKAHGTMKSPTMSIKGDASTFEFRNEATVCFLNNPFGPPIFDSLFDNLEKSITRNPRTFYLIYFHAFHVDRVRRRKGWSEIASGDYDNHLHPYAIFIWKQPTT